MIYYYRKEERERINTPQLVACESDIASEPIDVRLGDEMEELEGATLTRWQQLLRCYGGSSQCRGDDKQEFLEGGTELLDEVETGLTLIENSFLLHAYYNYRHIRLVHKNDAYYIAVPGNYYVREKAVARMFGFTHFDCEVEQDIPSATFGYYLIEVMLKKEGQNNDTRRAIHEAGTRSSEEGRSAW